MGIGSGIATTPFNPSYILVKPSGLADDVAINLAISTLSAASGGVVELAPGTYDIASSIVVPSNIWVRGSGIGNTTLKLRANTAYTSLANIFYVYAQNAEINNFKISDMTLDGNVANQIYSNLFGFIQGSVANGGTTTITTGVNDTLNITLNGATTATATIAASSTGASGVTYTLGELVSAVNTALVSAFGASKFYVAQKSGNLVIASQIAQTGTVVVNSGTAVSTILGTITTYAGSNDGGFNGIVIRGSQNYLSRYFELYNLETKNCGYHGIALYDGVRDFSVHKLITHGNNFRGIHCHSDLGNTSTGAGLQWSGKGKVYDVECYGNGQGFLQNGNTGFFVGFDNTRDLQLSNISVYNEKGVGINISGDGGDYLSSENNILTNCIVKNCGAGLSFTSTNSPQNRYSVTNNIVGRIGYNFIQGNFAPAFNLVITAGTNDSFVMRIAEATRTVVVAAATYTTLALLATAVQNAINLAFAADGSSATVTANGTNNFLSIKPTLTNGQLDNSFSICALSTTNFGLNAMFGGYIVSSGALGGGLNVTTSNNKFVINLGGVTKLITITVTNYNLVNLIIAIQSALDAAYPSGNRVIAFATTSNLVGLNPVFTTLNANDIDNIFQVLPESTTTGYAALFGAAPTSMVYMGGRLSSTGGAGGVGISFSGNPGGQGMVVSNNNVYECLGSGMNTGSITGKWTNFVISNNTVTDNGLDKSASVNGCYFFSMTNGVISANQILGNGVNTGGYRQMVLQGATGVNVTGNMIDNGTKAGSTVAVAFSIDSTSTNCNFTGNTFNRNTSGNSIVVQGTGHKFNGNYYQNSGVILDQGLGSTTGTDFNFEISRSSASSITSNVTLASDAVLVTPTLAQGAVYDLEYDISLTGSTLSTTGLQVAILLGTGQTMVFDASLTPDTPAATNVNFQSTTTSGTALVFSAAQQATTTIARLRGKARIVTTTTNAAVNIQFAQNTSSATALVIGVGSKVIGTRIS